MKARVLVAVVGIPFLLLVLIWAPDWATMLLVAAMCAIGAHEFMHAVAGEKGKCLVPLAVVTAALVPVTVYLSRPCYPDLSMEKISSDVFGIISAMGREVDFPALLPELAMLLVFLLFVVVILRYGKPEKEVPFSALTAALFAGLAFPLMLSCLLRLRLLYDGVAWVFVPLCISFGSDTFALFAGMFFGKHKLAPHVSPKKTKEGAVGGLVGGVFGLLLFKWIGEAALGTHLINYPSLIFLGLYGSAISQIGDLSFSVIKREFGVKDYGKLLPGHGGILDRFDSVTFVAPFVWLVLSFLR